MNNNKNLPLQPRLCREESLESLQFNPLNASRSLMELTIMLILLEQDLMEMKPDDITDRTHDSPDNRYNYLGCQGPNTIQHLIVVAIGERKFFSYLNIPRRQDIRPSLELIEEISEDITDNSQK